jgi:hypothetical protein
MSISHRLRSQHHHCIAAPSRVVCLCLVVVGIEQHDLASISSHQTLRIAVQTVELGQIATQISGDIGDYVEMTVKYDCLHSGSAEHNRHILPIEQLQSLVVHRGASNMQTVVVRTDKWIAEEHFGAEVYQSVGGRSFDVG